MSQWIVVYCHGQRRYARYLGKGWALCPCGQKLRTVTS